MRAVRRYAAALGILIVVTVGLSGHGYSHAFRRGAIGQSQPIRDVYRRVFTRRVESDFVQASHRAADRYLHNPRHAGSGDTFFGRIFESLRPEHADVEAGAKRVETSRTTVGAPVRSKDPQKRYYPPILGTIHTLWSRDRVSGQNCGVNHRKVRRWKWAEIDTYMRTPGALPPEFPGLGQGFIASRNRREKLFTFVAVLLWREGGVWVGPSVECARATVAGGLRGMLSAESDFKIPNLFLFTAPIQLETLVHRTFVQEREGVRQVLFSEIMASEAPRHPVLTAALAKIALLGLSRAQSHQPAPHEPTRLGVLDRRVTAGESVLLSAAVEYARMAEASRESRAQAFLFGHRRYLDVGNGLVLRSASQAVKCRSESLLDQMRTPNRESFCYPDYDVAFSCPECGQNRQQIAVRAVTSQNSTNNGSSTAGTRGAANVSVAQTTGKEAGHRMAKPVTLRDNKDRPPRRIPRVVHQIDFKPSTRHAKPPMFELMQRWRDVNQGYEYVLWTEDSMREFVLEKEPQMVPVYDKLDFVQRSDFFRYFVLFYLGGVYADHDAEPIVPVDDWPVFRGAGLVLGVEAVGTELQRRGNLWARNPQFCQWVLAAAPRHPAMRSAVLRIRDKVLVSSQDRSGLKGTGGSTFYDDDWDEAPVEKTGGCLRLGHRSCVKTIELTGPGLFTDVVAGFFSTFGVSPDETLGGLQVGDVQVLTADAFSCGQQHSGVDFKCNSSSVLVRHHFAGNWKTVAGETKDDENDQWESENNDFLTSSYRQGGVPLHISPPAPPSSRVAV